jgi:hypothetical protein
LSAGCMPPPPPLPTIGGSAPAACLPCGCLQVGDVTFKVVMQDTAAGYTRWEVRHGCVQRATGRQGPNKETEEGEAECHGAFW